MEAGTLRNICSHENTGPRVVVSRGREAGSRPHLRWGKADDTGEETGTRTRWDRRGTGSSIQGKIFRDNVGKLPWAAGAEYNLQGLFERG